MPAKKTFPPQKTADQQVIVKWPQGQPHNVRRQLLAWYEKNGRAQLPWVATPNANGLVNDYHIAVSEVMMQQTTVAVGLKRFPLWLETFPTWNDLACASSEQVMKAWEGLGYYARARSLHKMAQKVVTDYQSRIPEDRNARLDLPGVGPTTASALGAFVYGNKEPIWDANVNRIWKRWWGDLYPEMGSAPQKKWEWAMSQQAMPSSPVEIRKWTQAVMDLGATVCTAKSPQCEVCPWKTSCRARALGTQHENPSKKPILVRQQMWKNWIWVSDKGCVAVVAPPPQGIWSGLWQLPECTLACPVINSPLYTTGKHKLSHRDVFWSVLKVSKDQMLEMDGGVDILNNCIWKSYEQWSDLALPQPLRKWWDLLSVEEQQKWSS